MQALQVTAPYHFNQRSYVKINLRKMNGFRQMLLYSVFYGEPAKRATRGQANQTLGFGPLIEKYLVFI